MIQKIKQYIYKKDKLKTSKVLKIFKIKIYEDTVESDWPCDIESIQTLNNKKESKNEKIGFRN